MSITTMAEYQARTADTAIYPGAGTSEGITYVTLGLLGELSELLANPGDRGESGDVLWYLAQAYTCLDSHMPSPGTSPADTGNLVLTLVSAFIPAGRLAEHTKKAIRDNAGVITEARRLSMLAELGSIATQLYRYIGDTTLSTAQANLDKLASRKVRGVLSGEGDQR